MRPLPLLSTALFAALLSVSSANPVSAQNFQDLTGSGRVHPAVASSVEPVQDAAAASALELLPFRFLENRGQWDSPARFVGTKGRARVHVEPSSMTVEVSPDARGQSLPVTRFVFEGASDDATAEGALPEPGLYNFFTGSGEDARSVAGLTAFGQVLQRGVYEGVDVRLRSAEGRLEYDVLLAPGAELTQVVVRCEGVEQLELSGDGRLLLHTAAGEVLEQSAPRTWAVESDGTHRPLDCRYVLLGDLRYGYALPERASDLAVVIDPALEWSTFLGGNLNEDAWAIGTDPQGRVVVGGYSSSMWSLPGTGAPFNQTSGNNDCFVAVLDPAGNGAQQVVWWTYLGGSANDWIWDIETNAAGEVFVTGDTASSNFPVTSNAYDMATNGSWSAFVARLDPAAGTLLYSTYLGGFGPDRSHHIHLVEPATVTVSGTTEAADFPITAGAFDATLDGDRDLFLSILDLDQSGAASLLYSTYVGGSLLDGAPGNGLVDIERRPNGNVVLATISDSTDWPVTANAYQSSFLGGQTDGVVIELDPSASGAAGLVYGSYLGGSDADGCTQVELEPGGGLLVAGFTYSPDFPSTPDAPYPAFLGPPGFNDAFIVRIDPALSTNLLYGTFIQGDGFEGFHSLRMVDGTVFAVGFTGGLGGASTNLPTSCSAFEKNFGGGSHDGLLVVLTPAGNGLDDVRYLSYVGGNGWENASDIHVESTAGTPVVLVSGVTTSSNLPTTSGAIQPSYSGNDDGFVMRLKLNPFGVCVGNPNTVSPIGARLCASGSVKLADNSLVLLVDELPQNSFGLFVMSNTLVSAFPLPAPNQGELCLGAPQVRFASSILNSGTIGQVDFQPDLANIPPPGMPLMPGDTAYFQYWYRDTMTSSNTSSGIAVTFE